MARAWYIVSSSILLNFSSLRKIGDALQVRRQLTQIGVGGGGFITLCDKTAISAT